MLAYDEATSTIGYYPILATWVHEDPVIVLLTIDGETIETTPAHPFYTAAGHWAAAELQINLGVVRVTFTFCHHDYSGYRK